MVLYHRATRPSNREKTIKRKIKPLRLPPPQKSASSKRPTRRRCSTREPDYRSRASKILPEHASCWRRCSHRCPRPPPTVLHLPHNLQSRRPAWIGTNDMASVHQRPSTRNHLIHNRRSNTYPAQRSIGCIRCSSRHHQLGAACRHLKRCGRRRSSSIPSPPHIHSSQFRATNGIAPSANARGPVDRPRQTRRLTLCTLAANGTRASSSRLRQALVL